MISLAEIYKHSAIRNLENACEELEEKNPDPDLIAKWLGKVAFILKSASPSPEVMEKAKAVLAPFGIVL